MESGKSRDAIRRAIEQAQTTQEIIGIHLWRDEPDIFICGVVIGIGASSFEVKRINTGGQYTGPDRLPFRQVRRIVRNSLYLHGLVALSHCVPKGTGEGTVVTKKGDMKGELPRLVASQEVVRVRLIEGEDLFGVVVDAGADYLEILRVWDGGISDGTLLLKLSDVNKLTVGSEACHQVEFLARHAGSMPSGSCKGES